MYESITEFLPMLDNERASLNAGVRINDDGSISVGHIYAEWVLEFIQAVCAFTSSYEEVFDKYGLDHYRYDADIINNADSEIALAIIVRIIRNDRFCDGALASAIHSGLISQWVRVLEKYDKGLD